MNANNVVREWRIGQLDPTRIASLVQGLHVSPTIAHLMVRRGLATVEDARLFLGPDETHLSDPFALRGMRATVERIHRARERGEYVVVFGDYDVDGIAATAIMVRALKRFGIDCCGYALPERLVEGYGLAPQHVAEAKSEGAGLLITVDNGISSHDAAVKARQLGLDLIVTDHHTPPERLPDAFAIINPKLEAPEHPSARACGALVALKVAYALTEQWGDIDLAALGVIADVMPLKGENRVLVALGLKKMAQEPHPGLAALAKVAQLDLSTVTAEDVAFQMAPRINADGRLGTGMSGIQLLLVETLEEAAPLARQLDEANRRRRAMESEILNEAIVALEQSHGEEHRSIVLTGKGWHPGVIGVVASRLKGRYGRPVVMLSVNEEGLARGSARGVEGFDLMNALQTCEQHLVSFGGHVAAAGLTVDESHIEAFREAFEQHAAMRLPEGVLREPIDIDALVSLSQLDVRFVKALDILEPYGSGNPKPLFACCGVSLLEHSLRELTGGHLRFSVKDGPRTMEAIAFGMGARMEELSGFDQCDIAFTPRLKTWRGQTSIQLMIRDVRACPDDPSRDQA